MRIAVVTAYDDKYASIGLMSDKNKKRYCQKHGYDFFSFQEGFDTSRPPSWSKIKFIKKVLTDYDYVFWSDADSLIVREEIRLETFLESRKPLVVTTDNHLQCGHFFVSQAGETILDDMDAQTQFNDDPWWEQAALNYLYPKYKNDIAIYPLRAFNSNYYLYRHGDFLCHFNTPKRSMDFRLRAMKQFEEYDHQAEKAAWNFCENFVGRNVPNTLHFQGVPILKNPLDLWVYQELIYEVRPSLIVECGTNQGGSALYFATMAPNCEVITIDIEFGVFVKHPRVSQIVGDSTSLSVANKVYDRARKATGPILVILDSDHNMKHVYKELEIYSPLVSVGSYCVVEDTHLNGYPISMKTVNNEFVEADIPGPREAVMHFLGKHEEFEPDLYRQRLMFSFNHLGWLKRLPNKV